VSDRPSVTPPARGPARRGVPESHPPPSPLLAAARANAALALRDFVTPDDVKRMAPPVLEHRLILRPEFEVEGLTVEEAVKKVLASVPVPV